MALAAAAVTATGSMRVCLETLAAHVELVLSEHGGSLTPEQLRFLQTADGQSHRLLQLIDDLRLVALAEQDQGELEWAACSLTNAVERAVRAREPFAHARRTPIELASRDEQKLVADARQIERAVVALLDVALERAETGSSIRVDVGAGSVEVALVADAVPEDTLGVLVAQAVARLHGGDLRAAYEDGTVTFSLGLAAEAPRRLRAVA